MFAAVKNKHNISHPREVIFHDILSTHNNVMWEKSSRTRLSGQFRAICSSFFISVTPASAASLCSVVLAAGRSAGVVLKVLLARRHRSLIGDGDVK